MGRGVAHARLCDELPCRLEVERRNGCSDTRELLDGIDLGTGRAEVLHVGMNRVTFVNAEAVHYGFASSDQAKSIVDWLDGRRLVDGDTSVGDDLYHFSDLPGQSPEYRSSFQGSPWMW